MASIATLTKKSEDRQTGLRPRYEVTLLTGGFDRPYAFGIATSLAVHNVELDVIGSDDVDAPEMHSTPGIRFLNLRGSKQVAGVAAKVTRVLSYYRKLISYAATSKPKIFHILWNNKFQIFDRTLLMMYYRMLGKKIVFTAHNVNAGERDGNDSLANRLSLRAQYRLCDHIFVHTDQMKADLREKFGVDDSAITVIPFGINNSVPVTALSREQARESLGLGRDEKVVLFFGAIRPYKGLEYLVDAFLEMAQSRPDIRLVVGGFPKEDAGEYMESIERKIDASPFGSRVIRHIRYIPDEETERYFKAADVLALPYTHVFQSGVLFLAFSFGLPVIATDVGSVRDDIVEGRNGFLCEPRNASKLGASLNEYFSSELYKNLEFRRAEIQQLANERHSWDIVAEKTRSVYGQLAI